MLLLRFRSACCFAAALNFVLLGLTTIAPWCKFSWLCHPVHHVRMGLYPFTHIGIQQTPFTFFVIRHFYYRIVFLHKNLPRVFHGITHFCLCQTGRCQWICSRIRRLPQPVALLDHASPSSEAAHSPRPLTLPH